MSCKYLQTNIKRYFEFRNAENKKHCPELGSAFYILWLASTCTGICGAFACVLADYWTGVWGERGDVLLREVNEGALSSLLLLSSGEINDLLGELSEREIVVRQRRVPPFKVSRNWQDNSALWREHLYT